MSLGRTGLILRIWAEVGWFNTVKVKYAESFETHDTMTSIDTVSRIHSFPSRFRAELYCSRINAGQFNRYLNTEFDSGFIEHKN